MIVLNLHSIIGFSIFDCKNGDEELTRREYIVGYPCKILYESKNKNQ